MCHFQFSHKTHEKNTHRHPYILKSRRCECPALNCTSIKTAFPVGRTYGHTSWSIGLPVFYLWQWKSELVKLKQFNQQRKSEAFSPYTQLLQGPENLLMMTTLYKNHLPVFLSFLTLILMSSNHIL